MTWHGEFWMHIAYCCCSTTLSSRLNPFAGVAYRTMEEVYSILTKQLLFEIALGLDFAIFFIQKPC